MARSDAKRLFFSSHLAVVYVFFTALLFLSTEALSSVKIFQQFSVRSFWIIVLVLSLVLYRKKIPSFFYTVRSFFLERSWQILSVLPVVTFIQGLVSAPNTTDALVYHLPRMLYWIQEQTVWQSVIFTSHDYMPPLSGYFFAHFYLFFGNDRFLFFPQWLAGIVSLSAVYALSLGFTHQRKNAYWITLFVSTLPMLAFQMSSTQVDTMTMAFILCSYLFAFSYIEAKKESSLLLLGLSAGFSVMTKPTAVFWLLPLSLYLLFWLYKNRSLKTFLSFFSCAFIAVLLQLRWLLQNRELFGMLLGEHKIKDGAVMSFTNDYYSLGILISNFLRNIFLQFPLPVFGNKVEQFIDIFLKVFGTSLHDAASTWYGSVFHIQRVIFPQEDIVASPLHMGSIVLMTFVLLWRKKKSLESILLGLSWVGFLFFSLVLRWQPYHSRLLLPFLVLGTVFSSTSISLHRSFRFVVFISWVCTFLLLMANVSRPFFSYTPIARYIQPFMPAEARIPTSIFTTNRQTQYFHSRPYWQGPYVDMQDNLGEVTRLSFDFSDGYVYPFMILAKEKNENIRFDADNDGNSLWSGETVSTPSGSLCTYSGNTRALCLLQ